MKKVLAMVMSILMVCSITACGKKKDEAPSNDNIGSNVEINKEDYEVYYGKISSVAGNEIEVSIANNPFDNTDNDTGKPDDNQGTSTPTSSSSAAAVGEGEEENAGAEERIEMEFTGETKSFTIPAGAEIFQGAGQGGEISSLKKGSVVIIYTNKESGVVANVTIMG